MKVHEESDSTVRKKLREWAAVHTTLGSQVRYQGPSHFSLGVPVQQYPHWASESGLQFTASALLDALAAAAAAAASESVRRNIEEAP